MMKTKVPNHKALLFALLCALPVGVNAASPEEVVEARQGYYSLLGLEMGGLVAMVKGEIDYDADQAKAHAGDMLTLTKYRVGDLYMPGTSKADLPGKTRALAKIWGDGAGVQEKGEAFVKAVIELNERAGLGRGELAEAVKQLGGTCKGCHDDYRAKDF